MTDDDDHNKLCDMLTQLVVSALPAEDKHNSEKLHKLCQFVFRDTDIPLKVAALLLLAKRKSVID